MLGMHRSGTSVATRLMNLLGIDLGAEEHLLGPRPDNPKGFWEYEPIVDLNEEILATAGRQLARAPALAAGVGDGRRVGGSSPEGEGSGRSNLRLGRLGLEGPTHLPDAPVLETDPSAHSLRDLHAQPGGGGGVAGETRGFPEREVDPIVANLHRGGDRADRRPPAALPLLRGSDPLASRGGVAARTVPRPAGRARSSPPSRRRSTISSSPSSTVQRTSLINTLDNPNILFPAKALYFAVRIAARSGGSCHGLSDTPGRDPLGEQVWPVFSRSSRRAQEDRDELTRNRADLESRLGEISAEGQELRVRLSDLEMQAADREAAHSAIQDRSRELEADNRRLAEERDRALDALASELRAALEEREAACQEQARVIAGRDAEIAERAALVQRFEMDREARQAEMQSHPGPIGRTGSGQSTAGRGAGPRRGPGERAPRRAGRARGRVPGAGDG